MDSNPLNKHTHTLHSNGFYYSSRRQDKVALKLSAFSRLKAGWHYGAGEPISRRSIRFASLLSWQAEMSGIGTTDVFPGRDGDVEFAVYRGDDDFSFRVRKDGCVEIGSESGDMPDLPAMSLEAAQVCLGKIAPLKSWNSSIYSTSPITTLKSAGFGVWHLETPVTEAEFPSLTNIAPRLHPATSAPTLGGFTKQSLLNRQFIGSSVSEKFCVTKS